MLADQRGIRPNNVSVTVRILRYQTMYPERNNQETLGAKGLLDIDKEVAAGLYIYAVEEPWKITLIRKNKEKKW